MIEPIVFDGESKGEIVVPYENLQSDKLFLPTCSQSISKTNKENANSPRKAIDLVKKLVEVGYVTKISKAKDGKNSHACNLYRVHMMPIETDSVANTVMTNAESLPL